MVDSLLTPEFPITYLEAFGRRLRRNYIWLFLILGVAWAFKLLLHPGPANSIDEFLDHAAVGFIPGPLIALLVACFFLVISLTAVLTVTLQASPGEVLPRSEVFALTGSFFQNIAQAATSILPDELPFLHQHEHLTIIITDKAQEVSQQLLAILKRGVTALEGKGMYTGKARSVLLCVVAPSQIDNLKSAVYAVDEHAFVVVNPTEEILGTGFSQLEPRWQRNKKPK
jgi:hypothetical protein